MQNNKLPESIYFGMQQMFIECQEKKKQKQYNYTFFILGSSH